MDDTIDAFELLPCRKAQIELLNSILQFGEIVPRSLVIYGRASTGKTTAVTLVLNSIKAKHVLVNCMECDSSRLLFEFVLDELAGHRPTKQNKFSHYINCDNANDFIRHLNDEMDRQQFHRQPLYIIFKNAESLRRISVNVIPLILRLQELSQRNVCPILISGINPEKLCPASGLAEVLPIHFPEYTKDDLVEILMKGCPQDYSSHFYSNYLNLVLSIFYPVCRDLREIRYIARENFHFYVDPIRRGEVSEQDVTKLWRNIEPQLKSKLHQVYLRDSAERQPVNKADTWRIELPFYSKYLLIAAYLASYNPAKLDKQYFLKKHEKVSKRVNLNRQKRKTVSFHLLGPKSFPLERIIAIFCSIVDDSRAMAFPIYSQISSLLSLNFLQRIGSKDVFDSPKFKCVVSLDVIRNISRSVDFDIDRYLYDFN